MAEPDHSALASTADPEHRLESIRKERGKVAYRSVVGTLGLAQLMFWSFAVGASFGLAPLVPAELAIGSLLAFLIAASLSWPILRRRLEDQAKCVIRLQEGRATRRLAFHPHYLAIDQEVVLGLARVEREGDSLLLRYHDRVAGGPVVRSFTGSPEELHRAQQEAEALLLMGSAKVG